VGIPVVGIYGSSTPDYTPPLSKHAAVVYHRLACSPCFKRHCPLGHGDCLKGITVDEVWRQLNNQLGAGEQV
jgi:heptosyltransferase-2